MSRWLWVSLIVGTLVMGAAVFAYYIYEHAELDIYVPMFAEHCADCHGNELEGTAEGKALISGYLEGGDTVAGLIESIRHGNPDAGMPAFEDELTPEQIKGLAIYIGERRMGQRFTDFRFDIDLQVPTEVMHSDEHDFVLETVATGLDPMVFSIEPLPDGTILLTEKQRGISIVSPDGVQSELIDGTPETSDVNFDLRGIQMGVGWVLDVAAHPDYENNGWIYLHYTEICEELCQEQGGDGVFPASMNRLERGRIQEGKWVDVETIWKADYKHYMAGPDTGAGGRIAFDQQGHVFISVGMKSPYGPQDLNNPYGKIHRVNDDGTIPADNPFVVSQTESAGDDVPFTRKSIWTYGHRSPQGLEWNSQRKAMWEAEMGPRGGDEINELLAGRNYGWPFHSLGLEYIGYRVERHKNIDVEFDPEDIEMTLVDFTPSPAISSFSFYRGDAFPAWHNNVLLGSLKGSSLFRLVFDGNKLVHKETLIKDLARIRDVEVGHDGLIYLLLEIKSGSQIVRLAPAASAGSIIAGT